MKKTEIIKKTIDNTVVTTFCDVCGSDKTYHTCCYCEIDLCGKCIEYNTFEDYPEVYCKDCWTIIGSKYRDKINKIEAEVDKLYDEWKNECVENRKNK